MERWARSVATVEAVERAGYRTLGTATSVTWKLRVRFVAADGTPVSAEGTLELSQFQEAYVGQQLPILYDPQQPERFVTDETEEGNLGLIAAAAGNAEVAGLPMEEYLRLATQDPAALQAHTTAWAQQQIADGEAQMAAAREQAQQQAAVQDLPGQLARLAELHESGALTDDEYAAAKASLLGT